jgi:hypothetical protein
MVHPQVGPGADVTMTPFGVFPPQLQPYAQPFDLGTIQQNPYLALGVGGQEQYDAAGNRGQSWAVDGNMDQARGSGEAQNHLGLNNGGLGNQTGGQTTLYWDTLIDGKSLGVESS